MEQNDKKYYVNLFKKYSSEHVKYLSFIDGDLVSEYSILAGIDLCVQEENYELAALLKKLLDIKFYSSMDTPENQEVVNMFKKLENKNKSTYDDIEDEEKDYEKYKNKKELERHKKLNELYHSCIYRLENKIVKNPFHGNDKYHTIFENFRKEFLTMYSKKVEENKEIISNLIRKLDS